MKSGQGQKGGGGAQEQADSSSLMLRETSDIVMENIQEEGVPESVMDDNVKVAAQGS
jgi:hypothetical protein